MMAKTTWFALFASPKVTRLHVVKGSEGKGRRKGGEQYHEMCELHSGKHRERSTHTAENHTPIMIVNHLWTRLHAVMQPTEEGTHTDAKETRQALTMPHFLNR